MAGSEDGGKRRDKKDHYRRAAIMHPLRRRILRLLSPDGEAGAAEIAAELDEEPGRISYHLRVLVRRGVLREIAKGQAGPARYRWSPRAQWARKMLDEKDARGPA